MDTNNRYCCLLMPCDIKNQCNYFEIDLQVKSLKKIIGEINKELNTNFISSSALIDDNYGIILYDNIDEENQYIYKLGRIKRDGQCLLISHMSNFDRFIKSSNINIYDDKCIKMISHNSVICRKMIFLCIYFITSKNE